MMDRRIFGVLALSAALAACGGEEGGDAEVVSSDTAAIQGQDTISVPTVVQTTDSVVTTTTVDTMQTQAEVGQDTVRR